ncbi:hypothetical protein STAR110904_02705 [Staphylococcus argensis]
MKQTQRYSVISVTKDYEDQLSQLQYVESIKKDKLLRFTTTNVATTLKELAGYGVDFNDIEITKSSLLETIFNDYKEGEHA